MINFREYQTSILLPDFCIENKMRVGTTKHIYCKKKLLNVTVKGYTDGVFLLQDNLGNKYILNNSNKIIDIPENNNLLICRSRIQWDELKSDYILEWDKRVVLGVSNNNENVESWLGKFIFTEERPDREIKGLRKPQAGALHAIAAHWSTSSECATVVMPTGTGKTETMMSTMINFGCNKILIIVPSDALRDQLFNKFISLGCLQDIGVIDSEVKMPVVGQLKHGFKTIDEVSQFLENINVVISTVSALAKNEDNIFLYFCEKFNYLFIDEAHHVAASSWNRIKKVFYTKPILQFTATPYRNDGKNLEGKIIYNYPLEKAQEEGYFKHINYHPVKVFEEEKVDEEIATESIKILTQDLENGLDHLLMVRCASKTKAETLLRLYCDKGSQYNPVLLVSSMASKNKKEVLNNLISRRSKIIVCVDMLGEGFDLPQLKIAALHDQRKSLSVTLQFIGRFIRTAQNVGDATFVVNAADVKVNREIQGLYSENPDWNKLLKNISGDRIQKEIEFINFINNFRGGLSNAISLWNLRPGSSVIFFETNATSWVPEKLIEPLEKLGNVWYSVNNLDNTIVAVLSMEEDVKWGKYKDIKNSSFQLILSRWDPERNIIYFFSSNYNIVNFKNVADEMMGAPCSLVCEDSVFRIFNNVKRPMVRNLGASERGSISYTMYFGTNVTDGLSKVERSRHNLRNIFVWGFEDGEKVFYGCSAKKGKIWSVVGGTIVDWKNWCTRLADKISSSAINHDITNGFLRPNKITEDINLIPLSVEWGEHIIRNDEDKIEIVFGESDKVDFYSADLSIKDYVPFTNQNPIIFSISSDNQESVYKFFIENELPKYEKVEGDDVFLKIGSREPINIIEYLASDSLIFTYEDGSFSYSEFFVKVPEMGLSVQDYYEVLDWSGVDIKKESQDKEMYQDSIQFRSIEKLANDFDFVINDDGSREAADIVALKIINDDTIKLSLMHCKYSGQNSPGSRIGDLYELCGQAQKCIKFKHKGLSYLIDHIIKRDKIWLDSGYTRFIKGNASDLRIMKNKFKFARINLEVSIIQPGLSRNVATDDVKRLISCTELYLKQTTNAEFKVYCSE